MPRIIRRANFETNKFSGYEEMERKHLEMVSNCINEAGGVYNLWRWHFAELFDLVMIKR